ncbi:MULTISPECIES: YitT family protein [Fusobacterium]|uniref:YitT family protein n=1 Tax=Fusobacterium TaxID=848 RepID=UPI001980D933|nr:MULTISPECIES: YitT family protein [Fusobacterium]
MKKYFFRDLFLITVGAFLIAFGIHYFYRANSLGSSGVTGISLILYYLFRFDMGITYALINIPLIILGYKLIGGKFILKTFYGTIITSLAFNILTKIPINPLEDKLVASIFGGIVVGLGLGSMFAAGGSSGGTDIIVKILTKYFDIPVGKAFFSMDFLILSISGFLFGKEIFMYTLVGVFACTKVIDMIQDGFDSSKAITIISDKSLVIKDIIMKEAKRGTTIIKAQGGYRGEEKNMLSCIVSRYEVATIKRIIRSIDENAFVYITDVAEVLGKGFKNLK